jgi:hypothetical protein
MNQLIFTFITAVALGAAFGAGTAKAESRGYYEEAGVEGDDMLKMRAGPGVGYKIVLGLPNGAALWVHNCERSGKHELVQGVAKASPRAKGLCVGRLSAKKCEAAVT